MRRKPTPSLPDVLKLRYRCYFALIRPISWLHHRLGQLQFQEQTHDINLSLLS
jgi:hypothetical protein